MNIQPQNDETQLLDDDFHVGARAARLQTSTISSTAGGMKPPNRPTSSSGDASVAATNPATSLGGLVVCPGTPTAHYSSQTPSKAHEDSPEESLIILEPFEDDATARPPVQQVPSVSRAQQECSWVSASDKGGDELIVIPPAIAANADGHNKSQDSTAGSRSEQHETAAVQQRIVAASSAFAGMPTNAAVGETLLEQDLSPRTLHPTADDGLCRLLLDEGDDSRSDTNDGTDASDNLVEDNSKTAAPTAEATTTAQPKVNTAVAPVPPNTSESASKKAEVVTPGKVMPPVEARPLAIGDAIECKWGGAWYPGTVDGTELNGALVHVRWISNGLVEVHNAKCVRLSRQQAASPQREKKDMEVALSSAVKSSTVAIKTTPQKRPLTTASQLVEQMEREDEEEEAVTRSTRKLIRLTSTVRKSASTGADRSATKASTAKKVRSHFVTPTSEADQIEATVTKGEQHAPIACVTHQPATAANDSTMPPPMPMFSGWFMFVEGPILAALPAAKVSALRSQGVVLDSMKDVVTCCNELSANPTRSIADGGSSGSKTSGEQRRVAIVADVARSATRESTVVYVAVACGAVVVTEEWLRACFMFHGAVEPERYLHPLYGDMASVAPRRPVESAARALSGKRVLFAGGSDEQAQTLLLAAGATISFHQQSDSSGGLLLPDYTFTVPGKRIRSGSDARLAEVPLLELPYVQEAIRKWCFSKSQPALQQPVEQVQRQEVPNVAASGESASQSTSKRCREDAPAGHQDSDCQPPPAPAYRSRPPPLEPVGFHRSQHESPPTDEAEASSVLVGDVSVSLGEDYYVSVPSDCSDDADDEESKADMTRNTTLVIARVVKFTNSPSLMIHVRPYEVVGLNLKRLTGSNRIHRGVSVQLGSRVHVVSPSALDLATTLFVLDEEMAQHVYYLMPSSSASHTRAADHERNDFLPLPEGSGGLLLRERHNYHHFEHDEGVSINAATPIAAFARPTLMRTFDEPPSPVPHALVYDAWGGERPPVHLHLKWAVPPQMRGGELYFSKATTLDQRHSIAIDGDVCYIVLSNFISEDGGQRSQEPPGVRHCGVLRSMKRLSENRMLLEILRSEDGCVVLVEADMALSEVSPVPAVKAIEVKAIATPLLL